MRVPACVTHRSALPVGGHLPAHRLRVPAVGQRAQTIPWESRQKNDSQAMPPSRRYQRVSYTVPPLSSRMACAISVNRVFDAMEDGFALMAAPLGSMRSPRTVGLYRILRDYETRIVKFSCVCEVISSPVCASAPKLSLGDGVRVGTEEGVGDTKVPFSFSNATS